MANVDETMVTLGCGVYGEGSVFCIQITHDAYVEALQEAIFNKVRFNKRYRYDASALTLYVAKKDGAWLKDDCRVKRFLQAGASAGYEEMRPPWMLGEDYLGADFQPGREEIHILVELPPRASVNPRFFELQELLLRHVLMDTPLSTRAPSPSFKARLCAAYECNRGRGTMRCMLLDTALPSDSVVATYLFRRQNAFLTEQLMGFSDIDDVRNGLLLCTPLQHAFDHFQISFLYDASSNAFRFTIFDRSLRSQRLFDKFDDKQQEKRLHDYAVPNLPKTKRSRRRRRSPRTVYDLETTFGDLEGRALCFQTVTRPFKRCLNLQARLARKRAIENQWIGRNEHDFEDFWSEGMSLAEKMELFFAKAD